MIPTKPFYLSATIISTVVGAVVSFLNLFHVNLSDLVPQITDAVGQIINATIAAAAVVGAVAGRFNAHKTQITLGPTPPALKVLLLVLAGGSASVLIGCAGNSLQVLDSDAVTALSAIQASTATALASGALPAGKTTSIVTDANTISSGLETLLTGQPLTAAQVGSVAASFKSNSATTGYLQLANAIGGQLVGIVNAKLASGATSSQAVAAGTQVLVNAPSAVQAGITTGAPPATGAALPLTSTPATN
jgi:hypothetical protein